MVNRENLPFLIVSVFFHFRFGGMDLVMTLGPKLKEPQNLVLPKHY